MAIAFKTFSNLLRGAVLGLLIASSQAQAEDRVIDLTVTTDPLKLNGSPWDGYPAVGGRVPIPDESNAPDIAVCLVLATGAPECIWRTERKHKLSHCPDSTKCTINGIRVPALPLGLIFLDVDLLRHDLIDFVILSDGSPAEGEIEKVEANLHAAMANLTPGITPAERQRRQRKARVLPIDLCVGANAACDLTQSRFYLERR